MKFQNGVTMNGSLEATDAIALAYFAAAGASDFSKPVV